jgi:hypothetical protein
LCGHGAMWCDGSKFDKHCTDERRLRPLAFFPKPMRAVITSISYFPVGVFAAVADEAEDEIGKSWHRRGHAPAAFGDDTAVGWGDRSGRSAVRAVSKRIW